MFPSTVGVFVLRRNHPAPAWLQHICLHLWIVVTSCRRALVHREPLECEKQNKSNYIFILSRYNRFYMC